MSNTGIFFENLGFSESEMFRLLDGGFTRDRVIDWDKEVSQYITEEFNPELGNEYFKEFLSMPMKDLMNEIQISKNWFEKTPAQFQKEQEREDILTTQAAITVGTSYEEWEEMLDDNQKADEIIEKMQVNGGLSEAAIEAEMKAQEKPRADYLDADGNPHWNNEEEIDEPFDMAGYEYDEYIHSDEFIEKFGDWEKANRLEKLKEAETIVKDGTIVIDNFDYTAQIDKYEKEQNLSQLKLIGEILGDEVKGTYNNIDVNSNSIKEIKRHDTKDAAHIKSIYYIPDFLTKGTFISKEKNEDIVTHRKITEYQYLISGLNINNIDYTVKSAIAVDDVGNKYYDHKLSKIEKGNLLASLSSVSSQGKYSDFLFPQLKDKRLLQICQVAQIPYLERNSVTNKWQPKEETVRLVKQNLLHVEKKGQVYYMVDTSNSLNEHIHNLEQQLSEKDEELTIWIEKAQKSNVQISSLSNQLEKANKTIQQQNRTIQEQSKQIKEQDQLLNGKGSVKINGVERTFEHGLKHAFPEAVKQLDIQIQINKDLTRSYNELVKSKSNNISQISPSDDGNTYS